jgi:threonyl-tRNA synthetase
MLVVGDREEEVGAVAVRSHADGDLGGMALADFVARIEAEVAAG